MNFIVAQQMMPTSGNLFASTGKYLPNSDYLMTMRSYRLFCRPSPRKLFFTPSRVWYIKAPAKDINLFRISGCTLWAFDFVLQAWGFAFRAMTPQGDGQADPTGRVRRFKIRMYLTWDQLIAAYLSTLAKTIRN